MEEVEGKKNKLNKVKVAEYKRKYHQNPEVKAKINKWFLEYYHKNYSVLAMDAAARKIKNIEKYDREKAEVFIREITSSKAYIRKVEALQARVQTDLYENVLQLCYQKARRDGKQDMKLIDGYIYEILKI